MRIYLIGFMGCGKSTIGKDLSRLLNVDFIDMDTAIENKYQFTISGIFERFDEKAFRILEKDILTNTANTNHCVIATGGGAPCFSENMDWMNQNGLTVYIKMDARSLYLRLAATKKKRPFIENKPPDEVVDFIRDELKKRSPFYEKAQVIIPGEHLHAQQLMETINKTMKQNP